MRVDNAVAVLGFNLAPRAWTCEDAGMGKVINLAAVKKARARADAASKAAENRAVHGRSKAERARDSLVQARLDRQLHDAKVDEGQEPST